MAEKTDIPELEALRELHREEPRQTLREALADDIRQRLAINRAVYAAGYGIDPRPYGVPMGERSAVTQTVNAAPAAGVAQSALSGLAKAGILALAAGGGLGGAYGLYQAGKAVQPAVTAPAAAPTLEPLRGQIRFWVDDDGATKIEDTK